MTPTRITMDAGQMAAAGITEPISFTIPAGFDRYNAEQRHAWGREQIRKECDTLVRDLAQTLGVPPGPDLEAVIAKIVQDAPIADVLERD